MHIFVFQELAFAHNHNASGCTGGSISVDVMAAEPGDEDEMGELLRRFDQEIRHGERDGQFDLGGRFALSPLFSLALPPSLTPPLSQKSSSRESDRGCVRPSAGPRRRATVRNQEELCKGRPRWRHGAREG